MEKIVVNMGVSASLEKGAIDDAAKDLAMITGRKPVDQQVAPQHREFQIARRPADRLPRDAAPRCDV